jgi:small-conductance mechanosensitive channel
VRFWIRDPQKGLTNIRGQVLLALWDSFKEHEINIPFPHREIIMRTPVEVTAGPDAIGIQGSGAADSSKEP